ncbi:cytochrome P450 [Flagelloscypha sp. PMI_526]|nr:cytochrome P450 [Flagelloscypha sp. PMI_526]
MSLTAEDLALVVGVFTILLLLKYILGQTSPTTSLNGPPSSNFITGALMDVFFHDDPPSVYVTWAQQYGHAFKLPRGIGANSIVLCDPKAAQHVLSKDTNIYVNAPFRAALLKQILGNGILSAEGENHRRQRKSLSPAFANSEIRKLTATFYESAYKASIIISFVNPGKPVKEQWETLIGQNDGVQTVVNVQEWLNKVSLDSMGKGIFAHDFNSLSNQFIFPCTYRQSSFARLVTIFGEIFPFLRHVPTKGMKRREMFTKEGARIAESLIDKADSIIEDTDDKLTASLLLRHKRQKRPRWKSNDDSRLREELNTKYPTQDPTWDELWRLKTMSFPLSKPLQTSHGTLVNALTISKGSYVTVPLGALNRLQELWGPDAERFKPERWLDGTIGDSLRAKELQGHKHLLTFSDGPRICLGRHFALVLKVSSRLR